VVTSRTDLQTGNNADLWLTDLAHDTSSRLTFGGGASVQSAWSPDGRQIAWWRARDGAPAALYRKSVDGSGSEELLYTFDGPPGPNLTDWSPDGRFLVYARGGDVWALPVGNGTDATRKPLPVVQGPGTQFGAYLSHDGRWVAYISDETGRQELYVQPFTPGTDTNGASAVGGKWMVSRGTLGFARWRADGKELLFIGADGALMSVDVSSTPVFKASAPRVLFQLPQSFLALSGNPGAVADVTRDHQRLLLLMPSDTRQELSVVVNWQNGLSR
jgi:Tol biopolymer transport system component